VEAIVKATILSRIQRLEAASSVSRGPAKFRYGWLTPLPADWAGERHIVVTSVQPTISPNIEWCQFEERQGRAPATAGGDAFNVYLMPE
jgi:hypothetical protein